MERNWSSCFAGKCTLVAENLCSEGAQYTYRGIISLDFEVQAIFFWIFTMQMFKKMILQQW